MGKWEFIHFEAHSDTGKLIDLTTSGNYDQTRQLKAKAKTTMFETKTEVVKQNASTSVPIRKGYPT